VAELHMFGKPHQGMEAHLAQFPFVRFHGHTPNAELPYYYRGATLAVLSDVIAACPNSAIEALACGTPLVGYKAGVSPDMVTEDAGRLVACQGDPWKLEPLGNQEGLAAAALEIAADRPHFSLAARRLAEARYDVELMVDAYSAVLFA
jgi:glycosyltransferase involved in cell wall biosynthesis